MANHYRESYMLCLKECANCSTLQLPVGSSVYIFQLVECLNELTYTAHSGNVFLDECRKICVDSFLQKIGMFLNYIQFRSSWDNVQTLNLLYDHFSTVLSSRRHR